MLHIKTYRLLFALSLIFITGGVIQAQGYTKWVNGDTSDVVTTAHQPGLVLAGGGTDNDSAMVWMLKRAAGGDVVIIRASGSNGYNSYFFSELGVSVNSVETILFNDISAATNAYVIHKIRGAEALFIAGGDQYDYYTLWRNTPIEDAINYLINDKKVTVGGTSAGMAILGDAYYAPPSSSLTSSQALSNPYHPNINVLGKTDFIKAPFMANLITDTHYDQRSRQGRHLTFLARLTNDYNERAYGIACNEHTAVCIDGAGMARVFGEAGNDIAYFLKSNCQNTFTPEIITSGTPLTWNRQQAAVQVYKMLGSMQPTHVFDLNDWETASGGTWENWYADQGVQKKVLSTSGNCNPTSDVTSGDSDGFSIQVTPNPVQSYFQINTRLSGPFDLQLYDQTNRLVWSAQNTAPNVNIQWPGTVVVPGIYQLRVTDGRTTATIQVLLP